MDRMEEPPNQQSSANELSAGSDDETIHANDLPIQHDQLENSDSPIEGTHIFRDQIKATSSGLFFFLHALYPELALKIFEVFNCQPDPATGFLFMVEEPSIQCQLGSALFVVAVFGFVIYVVGIPLIFSVILIRHRASLQDESVESWVGFLYHAYGSQYWWWDLLGYLRRIVLLCFVTFLPTSSPTSVILISFFLMVLLVVQLWLKPYVSALDNWFEVLAIFALLLLHICNQTRLSFRGGTEMSGTSPINVFMLSFNIA
jgi:hypothetical protein